MLERTPRRAGGKEVVGSRRRGALSYGWLGGCQFRTGVRTDGRGGIYAEQSSQQLSQGLLEAESRPLGLRRRRLEGLGRGNEPFGGVRE